MPYYTKQSLREIAFTARMAIPAEERAAYALVVRDNFLASVYLPKGIAISGYIPFNSELDTLPLLDALLERGYNVLVPYTPPNETIIEFRTWTRKTAMHRTMYGILEPDPTQTTSYIPDIFIMPVLAFDDKGNRLGYGAGYFDQTLARLKGKTPFQAIGVAFESQFYENVPALESDYPMDMCVTEKKVHRFGK